MKLEHFVTILPVVDLDRANRFYAETLGLREVSRRDDSGSVVLAGKEGEEIELQKRLEPTKAEHTALSFEVPDIEAAVHELEGRGVAFEDYDLPGLTTSEHIANMDSEKAAWFKDPEGNILCLHQIVH